MTEKIALTVDDSGRLCTFNQSTALSIMSKVEAEWQKGILLPLDLNVGSINELRMKLQAVIDSVPDCKILLSAGIAGIPYYVFDKMGFSIFEAACVSDNLLNQITSDVAHNKEDLASESLISRTPLEITDGCYYLDYLLLESKSPEITTKKALLPFFDSTPFLSLTVRLSHLPPWLEFGEYANKYEITSKTSDNGLLLTIKQKVCRG